MNKLTINFQEGDLPSIHPHDLIVHLRGIGVGKLLFEGLTRVDEKGKIHLTGAESLDISSDRLCYTFILRDNKWSDGTPVTAFQYENAWKEALSPTSACSRADLLYLIQNAERAKKGEVSLDAVGVKAIDAKTLVVNLSSPSSFFLDLLAQPICAPLIDPKNKTVTAFNGPFMIDSWQRDNSLKLRRNPNFWNIKNVSLDQIDILMMSDPSTVFNSYENGQIDWVGLPISSLTTEQIQDLQTQNVLRSQPVQRSFWIHLNTSHPSLASRSIRKALSLAVDRTSVTHHIMIGGQPLRRVLSDSLLPVKMKTCSFLIEDQKEAQLQFQQGLLEMGVTKEQFPPLTISYAHANRKKFAEYLQETWKQVFGIDVRVKQVEWNVLRKNLESGDFEICPGYEAAYYHDPMEILDRIGVANPSNFSQWIDSGYRNFISQAHHESDSERRFQLLGKAEEILLQEMPLIPICTDRFLFAHHPGLKGYAFDSVGAIDFSYASLN